MAETSASLKKGQTVAFQATAITLLLALIKGIIGAFFGVTVLIADAFHSAADTIAIFASGFGLWLAARKKSKRFPYGLFKAETLVTLGIGGLISWAGIELLLDGFQKLSYTPPVVNFPVLPIIASIISMMVAFFIARQEKNIGEAIHSPSLLANASESFLDIISSGVVLVGILMAYWRIRYIEGVIIMLIALLILKLGLENFWKSLLVLLDANLDQTLQAQIEQTILDISGVKAVTEVKIRQAGPFRMVELKFTTNPSITVYQAHSIADEIETIIQQKFTSVESVFIHTEPFRKKRVRAIVPVSELKGLDSTVYAHFGRAPYFVILKMNDAEIEIEDFYLNEFLDRKQHIGLNVVKVIINYDLDLLFTNHIGEISFYMLKENFIDIYQVMDDNLTVQQVISLYQQNKLPRIIKPTHAAAESMTEGNEPIF
ncbi:cation diffusion facilitator family transporter [candidate division KSB1 bacterium]|nr:cation diffusion facilitator family transporter [candidate division KSB1 bacterium]